MHKTPRRKDTILAPPPRIYPILDSAHLRKIGSSAVRLAQALASQGARIAQYRHKGPFTRETYEEAAAVGAIFRAAGVWYVVNDRADIALAVGADGVHVGQEDLPPGEVRRLIGDDMLLGYSTHNARQVADEEGQWADYLAIGPVFGTATKRDPDPVVGLLGVREARSLTGKPLVGIGGITTENAAAVFAAGADSVSMIASISPATVLPWLALEG